MRDVLIQRTNGRKEICKDAYLQADGATVLIRQKIDGRWTTVLVLAPGTYAEVGYVLVDEEDKENEKRFSIRSTN